MSELQHMQQKKRFFTKVFLSARMEKLIQKRTLLLHMLQIRIINIYDSKLGVETS